jgi:hypothetical protein
LFQEGQGAEELEEDGLFQEGQGAELPCEDDALVVAPEDVQPCENVSEDVGDAEAEEDHSHEVPNWTVVDA